MSLSITKQQLCDRQTKRNKRQVGDGSRTCNLSSIAVAPSDTSSTSMALATSASRASRSPTLFCAAMYCGSHVSASDFDTSRLVTTSVRRPSDANERKAASNVNSDW